MESLQIISQWKVNDMDQTEHKMNINSDSHNVSFVKVMKKWASSGYQSTMWYK